MKRLRAPFVPSRTESAGFSLVEVLLSLAIVSVLFVAIIGLLPAGLTASRGAVDATIVSAVVEDVQNRLRGESLNAGAASFSPAYYDESGAYLPSPSAASHPFYRVEASIGTWGQAPANTSGLRPVTLAISWPVTSGTAVPAAGNPKVRLSFAVAPLTGLNWSAIDPSYAPKIEF